MKYTIVVLSLAVSLLAACLQPATASFLDPADADETVAQPPVDASIDTPETPPAPPPTTCRVFATVSSWHDAGYDTLCSFDRDALSATCRSFSHVDDGALGEPSTSHYETLDDFIAEAQLGVVRATSSSAGPGQERTMAYDEARRLLRIDTREQDGALVTTFEVLSWDVEGRWLTAETSDADGCRERGFSRILDDDAFTIVLDVVPLECASWGYVQRMVYDDQGLLVSLDLQEDTTEGLVFQPSPAEITETDTICLSE